LGQSTYLKAHSEWDAKVNQIFDTNAKLRASGKIGSKAGVFE